ncbi:hypoxanthine-guanine phosphoribosyltransferase [Thiocystis violascens]|uniref:Hypoxanthine-guanine phosphoribosyltransferase n=1 Tax=Thiocystis violascens (strain ATCC 17096 / DSM 198 / 6111) TaxID=765911 RepID=I3YDH1_THIV6|nr:hypoxanthine-guanine phosphoribosyltransferase [Thiocystis violascens]AFL75039.1 hypoxanthine-guanine phosphoribosyltransferase [Thiocystis violascens DSM 198]
MKLDAIEYAAIAGRADCLVTPAEMDAALDRMAGVLTERLAGKDPLVLCVMTGGIVVTGLLLPRLHFQLRLDYLHASRYRGTTSGGEIVWRYRPSEAIRGEHILVLDDVLDEGVTLDQVIRACHEDGAASVLSAVLVEKCRPHQCEADVVGVRVPNRYLYGDGLDYKNYFRNAHGVFAVADEDL